MNLLKIGEFLRELRKEKNMSQDVLAEKMHVDRANVSRWENGKTQIPTDKLKILSEIFEVPIDEILSGEKTTKTNKLEHNNIVISFISDIDGKIKKFKLLSFLLTVLIFILLIIFLTYYFIETYNTERIYKITSKSDNYEVLNGILFVTREQSYLKIGAVNGKIEIIELFLRNNDTDILLYSGSSDNIVVDFTGYNAGLNINTISDFENNLYMIVGEEKINLEITQQYVNDNFILKNIDTIKKSDNVLSNLNSDIPSKILSAFNCDDEICFLKNSDFKITYDIKSKIINIVLDNYKFMIDYTINTDFFNYSSKNMSFSVSNGVTQCYSSSCKTSNKIYEKYYHNLIKKYIE